MRLNGREIRAILLDLDGTVYQDGNALPGARSTVHAVREAGAAVRFVTNTSRRSSRAVQERLAELGVDAQLDELVTAPLAAAAWLRRHHVRRVALCLPEAAHEDFAAFTLDDRAPDAVVVGDLGEAWTYPRLNQTFRWLLDGATLVAIQKNRYWRSGGDLVLDAGPFVAALEFAARAEAVLVGKPSREFFAFAAASAGCGLHDVVMVGDDIEGDVAGAQAAGALGVLVRSGKFREDDLERGAPDAVIATVADLPALLGVTP